jgi:hypothetical protein
MGRSLLDRSSCIGRSGQRSLCSRRSLLGRCQDPRLPSLGKTLYLQDQEQHKLEQQIRAACQVLTFLLLSSGFTIGIPLIEAALIGLSAKVAVRIREKTYDSLAELMKEVVKDGVQMGDERLKNLEKSRKLLTEDSVLSSEGVAIPKSALDTAGKELESASKMLQETISKSQVSSHSIYSAQHCGLQLRCHTLEAIEMSYLGFD